MSDVVWAAAIAGGVGLAGNVTTYLATRRQAENNLRAAQEQAAVERHRIEAENERLRMEQAEPHLQHRQSVYHDFLDSAHRFHQAKSKIEPFDEDEARAWFRQFEHSLAAVRLFGTEPASRAAQELADVMGEAMEASPDYPEKIVNAYLAKWEDVIQAMRLDTSPEGRN